MKISNINPQVNFGRAFTTKEKKEYEKVQVQASIQGEQVRVSGKDKDDLQAVIKMLREKEDVYNIPLQFQNYR